MNFSTHWVGGWMGPRVSLNTVEKNVILLARIKLWFLGHPTHNLISIPSELCHLHNYDVPPSPYAVCKNSSALFYSSNITSVLDKHKELFHKLPVSAILFLVLCWYLFFSVNATECFISKAVILDRITSVMNIVLETWARCEERFLLC
jgi:hypothetical protein